MIERIISHDDFVDAMHEIEKISQKMTLLGSFDKLSAKENAEYGRLANLLADYEDSIPVFPPEPDMSFGKLMLIHMMDFKWKMAETAQNLGISETELSEILAGKRHINKHLNEKIHRVLDITPQKMLVTA